MLLQKEADDPGVAGSSKLIRQLRRGESDASPLGAGALEAYPALGILGVAEAAGDALDGSSQLADPRGIADLSLDTPADFRGW